MPDLRLLPRERPLVVLVAVTLVLSAVSMLVVDRPLALWLKTDLDPDLRGFFATVTDIGLAKYWFTPAVLGLLVSLVATRYSLTVAAHERWKSRAQAGAYALAVLSVSGILVNLIKFVIGRLRPRYLFESGAYGVEPFNASMGMNSFPSGHTQAIVAAMLVLYFLWPRHALLYLLVAVVIGLSRVMITVHYPSDVLAGAVLSIVVAVVLRRVWLDRGWTVQLAPWPPAEKKDRIQGMRPESREETPTRHTP